MKLIKNEKLEKSCRELQFSIEAKEFKNAVDNAYKTTAHKYNVHGFRKGKAPRGIIEKMYGAEVFFYDAINDLFPDAYDAAVKESGIDPVDRPEADIVSASLEEGAVLKVTVAVKPEVEIGEYKGLKGVKTANTVEESEVDAEIERMRERNVRIITREGAAENGDVTDINFEGFIDGVAFEGGKGDNFSLTLGSNQFIHGFEDQIIGKKAGEEFEVNVTFPEDYQAKEFAGKPALFKVKLNEVKQKEMPVLDDEFAKDVSEYDTVKELKESIRENMQKQADEQSEREFENGLVEQVANTLKGEIPEVMYENRIDDMVRDFDQRLQQQGMKLDDYLKYMGGDVAKFREGFKEQAEIQVKTRLALEAVAQKEDIKVSDEDFEEEVNRIAKAYNMEADKIRNILPEQDMKNDIAVNKAIDIIKENAKVTKKKEKAEKEPKEKKAKGKDEEKAKPKAKTKAKEKKGE